MVEKANLIASRRNAPIPRAQSPMLSRVFVETWRRMRVEAEPTCREPQANEKNRELFQLVQEISRLRLDRGLGLLFDPLQQVFSFF
jgi:hypothetical protein